MKRATHAILLLGALALFISADAYVPVSRVFTDQAKQRPSEQEVLDLLDELYRYGSGMMNVPSEDGRLLRMLVAASNAQRVLEIGTSNGVSAIWMGLGLRDTGGKMITIEINSYEAALARERISRKRAWRM